MKLYRQKLFSSLGSDVVYEFLGRLSGFIHRAKTLHWSAKGKDIHEYLDGFWKSLYEFQDTVAEGWMGIEGKISDPFEIPCIPADELYPLDFIREVEKRVLDFYNLIPADDPRYKGLSGETESFIQEIEKYKYLFGLCYGNAEEEKRFSIYKDWKNVRKVIKQQDSAFKELQEKVGSGGKWRGHLDIDLGKKHKFSQKFEGLSKEEAKKAADEMLKAGNKFNNKVALKRATPYAIGAAALGTAIGVGIHHANKKKKEKEKKFSEKSKKLDKKDWTALGLGSAGIIGGHMLKNKGENLGKDKLVEEARMGKLRANKNSLKLLQRASRDEMKAATDKEVYKKAADKFDKLGARIEQKTKEIAESEKLIKKLGDKSRKYKKAGKAVLITSMAAPIIYGSVRAVKKAKENKDK